MKRFDAFNIVAFKPGKKCLKIKYKRMNANYKSVHALLQIYKSCYVKVICYT